MKQIFLGLVIAAATAVPATTADECWACAQRMQSEVPLSETTSEIGSCMTKRPDGSYRKYRCDGTVCIKASAHLTIVPESVNARWLDKRGSVNFLRWPVKFKRETGRVGRARVVEACISFHATSRSHPEIAPGRAVVELSGNLQRWLSPQEIGDRCAVCAIKMPRPR